MSMHFRTMDETLESFAFSHDYRINHYEIKADFSWLSLGAHKLRFGGNAIYYMLDRGTVKPYGDLSLMNPVDLGIENAVESALYFADEITITHVGLHYMEVSDIVSIWRSVLPRY